MGFLKWLKSLFTKKETINDVGTSEKPPEMKEELQPFFIPSISVSSRRRLNTKLEKIIDDEIMRTMPTKFKDAIAKKDANAIVGMAAEALSSLKVREKSGRNDGVMVNYIQETTGNGTGDAWCMSGSQTEVAYAEKKTGKASKLYNSASCASVRSNSANMAINVKDSKYGDLWIWKYSSGNGHVGCFEGWIKYMSSAVLNECNTTAGKVGDKIVREGGGAYQTERSLVLDKNASMYLAMVIRAF